MNPKDFTYLNDEALPVMVLGINYHNNWHNSIEFHNKDVFQKIAHQSAGFGCHQLYLSGIILEPQDYLFPLMKHLNKLYLDSNIGINTSLDDIIKYREVIKKYGLDCKYTYSEFEEAVYPFDLPDDLSTVCKNDLPKDLSALIIPKEPSILNFYNWSIYILGRNCD